MKLSFFRDYKLQYLRQGPNRIGRKYKKVVYTQYTNESFIVRAEEKQRKNEIGILGPVIRAQIRDVITVRPSFILSCCLLQRSLWLFNSVYRPRVLTHPPALWQIVFKNMASRPYSIYPHGLTMEKSQEGVTYPEGGTDFFLLMILDN